MPEEKTYLELSQEDGGAHKFYEVIVDGKEVHIRYGRIGDQGRLESKTYPTPEKARAEAEKKIRSKKSKGYELAIKGLRKKRTVTQRQVENHSSTADQAPLLWKFATDSRAFGVFIDQRHCWVGNQDGQVFCLDHQAKVINQFRLPEGVKCIVSDEDWLYAGCDDGNVYDLNGKVPLVAYEIAENIDIYWLDIRDGVLGVSDALGNVTTINHEDESQWSCKSSGRAGWMVRCDEIGVYHGHTEGVTMYDWEDGSQIWHQPVEGAVLFGWQEESTLYVGTSGKKVYKFTKKGICDKIYSCDDLVFSCAATEDGKYVFAGDNHSSIYCFDQSGKRLWKLATTCGSAYSMQFFNDRLYVVTTNGILACIDASKQAIVSAQSGIIPQAANIKAPAAIAYRPSQIETTTSSEGNGVIVECTEQNGKLRVHVVSEGFHRDWNVQFPKHIREKDTRYLVDQVRPSARGDFYRAYGNIKKLI
jgi:outer membrane protein assembly factor BamB